MADVNKRVDVSSGRQVQVPLSVVRSVRSNISDFADTHEIFESGEENSDEKIARYILQCVDDFNSIPPIFSAGIEPLALLMPVAGPIRSLIITGASARLLRSVCIKLARNDIPITANNISMQKNSVWRGLYQIAADMKNEFEQKAAQLKIGANVAGGWGGTGGTGGIDALLTTPDGGWRAMLTEQYGGSDLESIYVSIDNF